MKLTEKKRIVVKVGTSTLTHDTGKTNIARMAKLVSVLADLKNAGHQVVLVSSGFHLARIKMLWARAGGRAENVSTLAAPVSHAPSAVKMFFREPLALVKSFVFDR